MKQVQKVKFPPLPPKLKRVAAYARVSSGKDAMLHSLAAQVEYYSNYIRRHPGWEYVGVYADEAKTGTKDSREQFERRTHKRLIDIMSPTQKTVEALMNLEVPAGVEIEIKL